MPTFKFYKGGKEVDNQRGANEAAVREKIAQHKWTPIEIVNWFLLAKIFASFTSIYSSHYGSFNFLDFMNF